MEWLGLWDGWLLAGWLLRLVDLLIGRLTARLWLRLWLAHLPRRPPLRRLSLGSGIPLLGLLEVLGWLGNGRSMRHALIVRLPCARLWLRLRLGIHTCSFHLRLGYPLLTNPSNRHRWTKQNGSTPASIHASRTWMRQTCSHGYDHHTPKQKASTGPWTGSARPYRAGWPRWSYPHTQDDVPAPRQRPPPHPS